MAKKAYWELLRDPRWQRMRLEVMERDEFRCQECESSDKTLNVHHTYYAKGRAPWEYEPESLRTLCEDCHASVTDKLGEVARLAGQLPPDLLDEMIGYLRYTVALNVTSGPDDDVWINAAAVEHAMGIRVAAGLSNPNFRADQAISDHAVQNGGKVSLWFVLHLTMEQARRRREAMARGEEIL